MKNTLFLVAGPPATGKSYFINELRNQNFKFVLITPDEIKENYADLVGFDNLEEKAALEKEVWCTYYNLIDEYMKMGEKMIVSEYPFSKKQRQKLKIFTERYQYQILTLTLTAEFDVLWARRYNRDREQSRHLSHIMSHYKNGDILENRDLADNHISKADFYKKIEDSQYNLFELGKTYRIDTTNYDLLNYSKIISDIFS